MNTQQVDPKAVAVWHWMGLIVASVCSLPFVGFAIRASTPFAFAILAVYLAVAVWIVWLYPRAYYHALEFGIDDHGITIERGVWWRSHTSLPRIRVQHSDVSQGPLQRRYGVATLKLYTAGSHYNKVELPGLRHDEAVAIRDALIAGGGDSGV
jgi:uncharacterized protein